VIAVDLPERENSRFPTKTTLSTAARFFTRWWNDQATSQTGNTRPDDGPVAVIFRYKAEAQHYISLASCERVLYKTTAYSGERPAKVSILRDIDICNPHTGHLKILSELKLNRAKKTDFEQLYKHWLQVFDVSILNKKFYKELSNWYFWAIKNIKFPSESTFVDDENHQHRAQNVIRMLTRLLFIWFLKEKKLIPEELFDLEDLQKDILKKIEPEYFIGKKQENRESIYYKAILQNLFFATLNCPISPDGNDTRKRGFRGEGKHFGVDYLMRYKKYFRNIFFHDSIIT
jgi:hypothetical protein